MQSNIESCVLVDLLDSFFLCRVLLRENKIYCTANCRPGNLDWYIYRRTPSTDQLHFTSKRICGSVRQNFFWHFRFCFCTDTYAWCSTVWREGQRRFALGSDSVPESWTQVSCSMFLAIYDVEFTPFVLLFRLSRSWQIFVLVTVLLQLCGQARQIQMLPSIWTGQSSVLKLIWEHGSLLHIW